MKTLILGIDPGFTGALAVIEPAGPDRGRLIDVIDMPLLKPSVFEKRPRANIDAAKLAEWVGKYARSSTHKLELCTVEKVSAAPGQGVVSMFRFGEGFGMIQGVLACHGLKTLYTGPSTWKASMNLDRNKTRSINAAKLAVEGSEPFLRRMKDHGRAEAMLLALFGARSIVRAASSLAKSIPTRESVHSGGDINDLF